MDDQVVFSAVVVQKLGSYVYRLIDPRNGQTFYVGKGKGNRVFDHVRGELGKDGDAETLKTKLIRNIRNSGFQVTHVIHRHGMDDETAREVEAALIDAYPEATNLIGGLESSQRGLMHAQQIIERYEAPEAVFYHDVVLINVSKSIEERDSVYEAVRWAWVLDPKRAANRYVLAVDRGLVVGVFTANWLKATVQNFPEKPADRPKRWGFIGAPAPKAIADLYLRHRLPKNMQKRGAANPIKYGQHTALRDDLDTTAIAPQL
jgi:hypothetical protein